MDETGKPKTANKGISYDDISHDYIKVPELRLMLKEMGPVDIFALDACLMQTAEVAYEIGADAGVVIASEDLSETEFYQYKERLQYLDGNAQEPAEKIASAFIDMRKKLLTPGTLFYSRRRT